MARAHTIQASGYRRVTGYSPPRESCGRTGWCYAANFDTLRVSQNQHGLRVAWASLIGFPRASVLLLGYAAEMYLKAGLAKAYVGCSAEMFDRDLKRRYGHQLSSMARDIDFPTLEEHLSDFQLLKQYIVVDARYPVTPQPDQDFLNATNSRTSVVWSRRRFAALCRLVRTVKDHVTQIDRDEQNPRSGNRIDWGDDGYLAWRSGGHLWQRLTFKTPKEIEVNKVEDLEIVRNVFDANLPFHAQWESIIVLEDKHKETKVWRAPRLESVCGEGKV